MAQVLQTNQRVKLKAQTKQSLITFKTKLKPALSTKKKRSFYHSSHQGTWRLKRVALGRRKGWNLHFPWNLTISGSMQYHMVHIIIQHIPTVLSNNTCNLTCDLHQRTGLWYGIVALLVSVLHSPVATEK